MSSDGLAPLAHFLDRHPRLLVLTGAGCSTPSGIPDYRDAAGTWKQRPPMSFADFTGSEAARRRYWAGSLRGWPRVRDARPSGAHAALAHLEREGRVVRVVTQNVDGLHQRSGSRRVLDLHGRLDTVECLGCPALVRREDLQEVLLSWNRHLAEGEAAPRPDGDAAVSEPPPEAFHVPACRECGGVLKPAVVFFGESVPRVRVEQALGDLEEADALLVVGSSLMVYSGFRFVLAARERGRPVAALNLGRTRADDLLDCKVAGDCADLLPAALASLAS